MGKRAFGVAVIVATLVAGAPGVGQEAGQFAKPSIRASNVGGLSRAGCEDLLGKYGVEDRLTDATPPEQILYCLGIGARTPPTPEEEEKNATCNDVRGTGTLATCASAATGRVLDALDSAAPDRPPRGPLHPLRKRRCPTRAGG